jgi:excisionase family DNA binding protein
MTANPPVLARPMPPRPAAAVSETDQLHPILITQSDLASLLGISKRKLERDRHIGIGIPFVKVGRRVLYRREDVLKFLEKNRFSSTAQAQLEQRP